MQRSMAGKARIKLRHRQNFLGMGNGNARRPTGPRSATASRA